MGSPASPYGTNTGSRVKYSALEDSLLRNLDVQQFKLYFSSLLVTLIDFSAFETVSDVGEGVGQLRGQFLLPFSDMNCSFQFTRLCLLV